MKTLTIFTLVLTITLAACGGSSQQMAGIDARGNLPPVGVVSKGTIAGFGSIIVNGVRYDTSNATINADGSPGVQGDLKVGQVVTVHGTLDNDPGTGVAATVTFDDLVEGPVSAIDTAAGTITVLSQLVIIDADTSFDDNISPASIDGLQINDIVEVSGFFLADGSISATRIEAKPAGSEFEVTGVVSNLMATTFQINNLVVDFSAAQLDDFPGGTPEDGQLVEAKGNSIGGAGQLEATRVEFKGNDLGADDGDQVEVEGFITRFVSATDFDVEGIPITTSGATVFENGTSADLAINRKVEVEGRIDANGIITATKIEIKLSNFIRIEGMVESLGASSVTIFGIQINVDSLTRYEDKSSADLETFGLANINVGNYLETRGYEDASGVVATRVEREDFDGEVAIRAFVDSVSEPNFTIHGVMIETNGNTVFRDLNDAPITATEFFAQAMGSLAEAVGTPSNGGIIADEVELED
ncbi:MAG: DUF5666 domain-containing protein [Woeseiaceae bacterium]